LISPRKPDQNLEKMRSPGHWPNWPLLPVRRPDPRFSGADNGRGTGVSFKQFGLMVAAPDRLHHVYIGCLTEVGRGPGATVTDALDPLARLEYDSYEAIVADGWTVD
jgi:hypothetical protein